MANEGSTKPTYSELAKMLDADRASLARVRGLLQRLGNAWEMDPHGDAFLDIMGELGAFDDVPPTFPQSSSVVSQGAESVDIGKLDTADKKVCTICGKKLEGVGIAFGKAQGRCPQ